MLGSGGVGSVVGVVSGGRSVVAASASTLVVSFMCRISEGSGSGVGFIKGSVVSFVVRSGWAGGSLVVVGHGSGWGGAAEVAGKGVFGSVAYYTGMGTESRVSSVVGSLSSGAEVAVAGSPCGLGSASS